MKTNYLRIISITKQEIQTVYYNHSSTKRSWQTIFLSKNSVCKKRQKQICNFYIFNHFNNFCIIFVPNNLFSEIYLMQSHDQNIQIYCLVYIKKMKIDSSLVAIVTGGASGLGQATVRLLASQKAKVVIADLNQKLGTSLAQQLGCQFFKTDVSSEQNVIYLFQFAIKKFGKVNAVINCAGIISVGMLISSKGVASSQQMLKVLKINVVGTFNMSKHAAKLMASQQQVNGQRGVIINVASVAGFQGQKGQTVYAASKGAILGMTLPMARDLGKFKIRVMTIAPGIFKTPMGSGLQEKIVQQLEKTTPLGRLGDSSEFALTVRSIIENPYATGTTWRLDGGVRLPYL